MTFRHEGNGHSMTVIDVIERAGYVSIAPRDPDRLPANIAFILGNALNDWLKVAPQAQAICSVVGAMVMMDDFSDRPSRGLADGEEVPTGKHRLKFLATPHVPHGWDAGMFFDEVSRTLFCSDLFFHPGDPEAATESEIVSRAEQAIIEGSHGPLAKDMPYTPYTDVTFERLAALKPATLATMHGSTFRGNGEQALRDLAKVIKATHGQERT